MAGKGKKKKEGQFDPAGPYKHKSGAEKRKLKLEEQASNEKLRKQSEQFFAAFHKNGGANSSSGSEIPTESLVPVVVSLNEDGKLTSETEYHIKIQGVLAQTLNRRASRGPLARPSE